VSGLLVGRVAIVTGASRGIGASMAERLAAEGAAVAVTARTVNDGDHMLPGGISATLAAITEAGGRAIAIPANLARPEDRERVVATTEAELGPVDILVNNAAVTYYERIADFRERHFEVMFDVDVRAPFELARRVLPAMRDRHEGWILNISSGASRHPVGPPYTPDRGGTVYGMCKAALERFTTGLASEVYADGIAVNVLSPSGLVLTPGVLHHQLDRYTSPERYEDVGVIVEAGLRLCTGDPATLTGRVAYARPLLEELGAVPG
jgi:citronellol/citronellal dehydrogenase